MDDMNDALSNSEVRSDLYMSLAGIVSFDFTESDNLADDIDSLRLNPTFQNLRNTYQADIVILLTNGDYRVLVNGELEYANGRVANIGPSEVDAYAIIEADHAASSFTFAHEVGHLFGGRHQNDFSDAYYEKGYSFKTGWIKEKQIELH